MSELNTIHAIWMWLDREKHKIVITGSAIAALVAGTVLWYDRDAHIMPQDQLEVDSALLERHQMSSSPLYGMSELDSWLSLDILDSPTYFTVTTNGNLWTGYTYITNYYNTSEYEEQGINNTIFSYLGTHPIDMFPNPYALTGNAKRYWGIAGNDFEAWLRGESRVARTGFFIESGNWKQAQAYTNTAFTTNSYFNLYPDPKVVYPEFLPIYSKAFVLTNSVAGLNASHPTNWLSDIVMDRHWWRDQVFDIEDFMLDTWNADKHIEIKGVRIDVRQYLETNAVPGVYTNVFGWGEVSGVYNVFTNSNGVWQDWEDDNVLWLGNSWLFIPLSYNGDNPIYPSLSYDLNYLPITNEFTITRIELEHELGSPLTPPLRVTLPEEGSVNYRGGNITNHYNPDNDLGSITIEEVRLAENIDDNYKEWYSKSIVFTNNTEIRFPWAYVLPSQKDFRTEIKITNTVNELKYVISQLDTTIYHPVIVTTNLNLVVKAPQTLPSAPLYAGGYTNYSDMLSQVLQQSSNNFTTVVSTNYSPNHAEYGDLGSRVDISYKKYRHRNTYKEFEESEISSGSFYTSDTNAVYGPSGVMLHDGYILWFTEELPHNCSGNNLGSYSAGATFLTQSPESDIDIVYTRDNPVSTQNPELDIPQLSYPDPDGYQFEPCWVGVRLNNSQYGDWSIFNSIRIYLYQWEYATEVEFNLNDQFFVEPIQELTNVVSKMFTAGHSYNTFIPSVSPESSTCYWSYTWQEEVIPEPFGWNNHFYFDTTNTFTNTVEYIYKEQQTIDEINSFKIDGEEIPALISDTYGWGSYSTAISELLPATDTIDIDNFRYMIVEGKIRYGYMPCRWKQDTNEAGEAIFGNDYDRVYRQLDPLYVLFLTKYSAEYFPKESNPPWN